MELGKKNLFRGATLKILKTFHYPTSLWLKTPCIPSNVLAPPRHEKTHKKSNAASNQGLELKESDVEDHDNHVDLFPCPEEGSIRRYQGHSSLQSHLGVSRHKYALERETLQDKAMQQYAQKSSVESEYLDSTSGAPSSLSFPSQGWALK